MGAGALARGLLTAALAAAGAPASAARAELGRFDPNAEAAAALAGIGGGTVASCDGTLCSLDAPPGRPSDGEGSRAPGGFFPRVAVTSGVTAASRLGNGASFEAALAAEAAAAAPLFGPSSGFKVGAPSFPDETGFVDTLSFADAPSFDGALSFDDGTVHSRFTAELESLLELCRRGVPAPLLSRLVPAELASLADAVLLLLADAPTGSSFAVFSRFLGSGFFSPVGSAAAEFEDAPVLDGKVAGLLAALPAATALGPVAIEIEALCDCRSEPPHL